MTRHGYKRPHYYLAAFAILVILTAIYVINLTDILGGRSDQVYSSTDKTSFSTSTSAVTKVFGRSVYGDIGAGADTMVSFVTQDSGGSGTFFYAVAFVKNNDQYTNTNSVFLGDRIAPQGLSISNGHAEFNYCDRRPEEPFTTAPSVCVTKNFQINNGVLEELPTSSI